MRKGRPKIKDPKKSYISFSLSGEEKKKILEFYKKHDDEYYSFSRFILSCILEKIETK